MTDGELNLKLKQSLHDRLAEASEHLTGRAEEHNYSLGFLSVRFLRAVLADDLEGDEFRKALRKAMAEWDKEALVEKVHHR